MKLDVKNELVCRSRAEKLCLMDFCLAYAFVHSRNVQLKPAAFIVLNERALKWFLSEMKSFLDKLVWRLIRKINIYYCKHCIQISTCSASCKVPFNKHICAAMWFRLLDIQSSTILLSISVYLPVCLSELP